MGIRIIVDSTADLLKEIKDQVTVVPLTLRFGDEEFVDGVDIDHRKFYEKLVDSDVLPTTSQATPAAYVPYFDEVKDNGDTAIVMTLAQKLSGTYQSATIAASDYDNIFVVESGSAAIGFGVLVEYAVRLVKEGKSAEEIVSLLEEKKNDVVVMAVLDTLEYLKKGGRISASVAFVGGVLNIKPVISLIKGEISMIGKARGTVQGNKLLAQEIEKAGSVDASMPLMFGYSGLDDEAVKKFVSDNSQMWKTDDYSISPIGSIIGTHIGPGAVAIAFFKNN